MNSAETASTHWSGENSAETASTHWSGENSAETAAHKVPVRSESRKER